MPQFSKLQMEADTIMQTGQERLRRRAGASATSSRLSSSGTTLQGWERLRAEGKSAREWAQEHGFSPELVYAVLRGERKCFRGKSHLVAIELGLKSDPTIGG